MRTTAGWRPIFAYPIVSAQPDIFEGTWCPPAREQNCHNALVFLTLYPPAEIGAGAGAASVAAPNRICIMSSLRGMLNSERKQPPNISLDRCKAIQMFRSDSPLSPKSIIFFAWWKVCRPATEVMFRMPALREMAIPEDLRLYSTSAYSYPDHPPMAPPSQCGLTLVWLKSWRFQSIICMFAQDSKILTQELAKD